MFETLCSNAFRLRMPRRLPLPSASLQGSGCLGGVFGAVVDFGRHFDLVLVFILRRKCLIVLVTF